MVEMTNNVTPMNISDPPTDRPFYIRAKDGFGEFDFGSPCVMVAGHVCTEKNKTPIHDSLEVLGWREVSDDNR